MGFGAVYRFVRCLFLCGICVTQVFGEETLTAAPEQNPQRLFISAHPSMFSPEDVFEGNVIDEPDFLPPEAYDDHIVAPAIPDLPKSQSASKKPKHSIQFAQYPLDDSGASDPLELPHSLTRREPRIDTATPNTRSVIPAEASPGWLTWDDPSLTTTVLPETSDGFGMTSVDARITIFSPKFPLLRIKPRFSSHFVSGPPTTDLPGRLYDFAIDSSLFLPINERWSFLGGVAPNMFSDFNNTTSDALRITGRGLVFYKWSDQLKLAAGIVYLNRDDISLIPAAGLVYTPSADLKLDLMFPKPKLSYRFQADTTRERWGYVAGEFGGGTWAIERTSGLNDVVTYRDYKLLLGIEHIQTDSYRWFAEAGYVFSRELEYRSLIGDTKLGSTGVIRAGITF